MINSCDKYSAWASGRGGGRERGGGLQRVTMNPLLLPQRNTIDAFFTHQNPSDYFIHTIHINLNLPSPFLIPAYAHAMYVLYGDDFNEMSVHNRIHNLFTSVEFTENSLYHYLECMVLLFCPQSRPVPLCREHASAVVHRKCLWRYGAYILLSFYPQRMHVPLWSALAIRSAYSTCRDCQCAVARTHLSVGGRKAGGKKNSAEKTVWHTATAASWRWTSVYRRRTSVLREVLVGLRRRARNHLIRGTRTRRQKNKGTETQLYILSGLGTKLSRSTGLGIGRIKWQTLRWRVVSVRIPMNKVARVLCHRKKKAKKMDREVNPLKQSQNNKHAQQNINSKKASKKLGKKKVKQQKKNKKVKKSSNKNKKKSKKDKKLKRRHEESRFGLRF